MTNSDSGILTRIGDLVEEEKDLRTKHGRSHLQEAERERLEAIEVELDQCWDLLNQRRAFREYGMDPEDAEVRPEETVERYLQ